MSMESDLSQFSMLELFRVELEGQSRVLNDGLLALEQNPDDRAPLEPLMRAAHSLKGAARIVNLAAAVRVAHVMEDFFVAAQKGEIKMGNREIDALLQGADLLNRIGQTAEAELAVWEGERKPEIDSFTSGLTALLSNPPEAATPVAPSIPPPASEPATVVQPAVASPEPPPAAPAQIAPAPSAPSAPSPPSTPPRAGTKTKESHDRVLRVTADNLNRLLGMVGESLVESRWLQPFAGSLLRLKRMQADLAKSLDGLRESLNGANLDERGKGQLAATQHKIASCHQFLSDRLVELEQFDRRASNLSHRLYRQVVDCRMRPFADGVHGFSRMVRDLARSLGKEVRLDIIGEHTQVDRDILEKLEAPLTHLLRNALDHGVESPDERRRAGKPVQATVRLEARHRAGMLQIVVADDGPGINFEGLRGAVVRKKLTTQEMAAKMSEAELIEFLFLPGFSMKEAVTEISGRGVGLDVVQSMIRQVRGTLRAESQPGKGMRFQLQLPLTLSVSRMLLVEIGGEPYAVPLAHLTRTLKLPRRDIQVLQGRQHFLHDGQHVGLVSAHQILELGEPAVTSDEVLVIMLGDRAARYGVAVDRFQGERDLVVQALDPRLGKVKDISAAALMPDGSPVLVIDVEDLIRSIERIASGGALKPVQAGAQQQQSRTKRVLVVDDSLTVRELERKLLESRGYSVDMAVDGMDGWNAVRTGRYDLVISDVDMPRMDGIELVSSIKKDARLKGMPVMIISYKDREEDRNRGLEAGADYYLTKGSFHDETLLNAVEDLIGEALAA